MNVESQYTSRQNVLIAVVCSCMLLLIIFCARIQIFSTEYDNKIGYVGIAEYPARGLVYDRDGHLLVSNKPLFDLMVTYDQIDPLMDTLAFCQLLQIEQKQFSELIEKDWSNKRFAKWKPYAFLKKIPHETYARFQEHMHKFPGFHTEVRNVREYDYPIGAHILGYLNEASPSDISSSGGKYKRGDFIGVSGIEKTYEDQLRGSRGIQFFWRDNLNRLRGQLRDGANDTLAIHGHTLHTSLDKDLQSYAEFLMQKKVGAVVAIEPSSGEILSLVSAPTYDPSLLTIDRERGKAFAQLEQDSLRPFFNRAYMAQYPPGSIFKSIMALIALEENVWRENKGVTCNGGYTYKDRTYGCHQHVRPKNISVALQHSCNTYFWQLFQQTVDKHGFYEPQKGLGELEEYWKAFGLGIKTNIDLPAEQKGFMPGVEYYDRLYPKNKGSWKSPTIMSIGIGQGELLVTPLQMANLAAVIANRGYYMTPHVVTKTIDAQDGIHAWDGHKNQVPIKSEHFEPIIDGMEMAVTSGTATTAFVEGLDICGKTGTSQNPHGEDHSVFFAFAPKENPQIAVAVFIENAGFGGTYAAPIASLMIEQYLNDTISAPRLYLEDRLAKTNLIVKP